MPNTCYFCLELFNAMASEINNNAPPGCTLYLFSLMRILVLIFPSIMSLASLSLIWILVVSVLEQYLIYSVGLIPSNFYRVLGNRDMELFHKELMFSVLFGLGVAFVKAVRWFLQQEVHISSRRLLCFHLHKLYFSYTNYYHLNEVDVNMDNPVDQMIEDVNMICTQIGDIATGLLVSPLVICIYVYFVSVNLGWTGPFCAVSFVLIGKVMSNICSIPVTKWSVHHQRGEENFRLLHSHVQLHSESLAFYDAGQTECYKANEKLTRLIDVQQNVFIRQLWLNIVINTFDYLGSILSYILLFVPIYLGDYENLNAVEISILISQNSFLFIYLMSMVSSYISLWSKITDMARTILKLGSFLEKLEEMTKENMAVNTGALNNVQYDDDNDDEDWNEDKPLDKGWWLENVTIMVPQTNHIVVQDLKLHIEIGSNLLIVGGRLCGKTSLLRVLRGLWSISGGCMKCSLDKGLSEVLYLPKVPVFTSGCLREQVTYPLKAADNQSGIRDDSTILQLLHVGNLEHLLFRTGGLDMVVPWSWYNGLSRNEQQQLCFLRVLYHCPKFVVADEATDTLSRNLEAALLQQCWRLNITTIMTTTDATRLERFHHKVLTLDGIGGWTLQDNKPSV